MQFPKPPSDREALKLAGRAIANETSTPEQDKLVDEWRASHSYVLNTFQLLCRRRLMGSSINADFAQRLKRKRTVVDKLRRKRPDGSYLIGNVTQMQDFAGCRLIFDNMEHLHDFRHYMNVDPGHVQHELLNNAAKYDYVSRPKRSGYRGIHDIFAHYPKPHRGGIIAEGDWDGLRVEIQYRTRVQHAWATAVELADLIDDERTKFEILDNDTQLSERAHFFALCSELLARNYEDLNSTFPQMTYQALVNEIHDLETRLGILEKLKSLVMVPLDQPLGKHNVINAIYDDMGLIDIEIFRFNSRPRAIAKVNQLENDMFANDPVYVGSEYPAQLRSAYRNYFKDAREFTNMIIESI